MMTSYYKEHEKFYVAVDIIIFGFDGERLNLLLIKRNFPPAEGKWSLMGGFLNKKESLDQTAKRVLFTLTGLNNVFLEQLLTYGDVYRDPGERVISVAYYALIKIDDYDENLMEKHNARWFPITDYPSLIFDHNTMVKKALARLRRKTKTQPIGLEMLPTKITIPRLQKLYEAIYLKKFDKRNFRKKILGYGVLVRLDEKEKESSKKGAFYYYFDEEKYHQLVENGFSFTVNV